MIKNVVIYTPEQVMAIRDFGRGDWSDCHPIETKIDEKRMWELRALNYHVIEIVPFWQSVKEWFLELVK